MANQEEPVVHKYANGLAGKFGIAACGCDLWKTHLTGRSTWRGVPLRNRCKNCLRTKGKRHV